MNQIFYQRSMMIKAIYNRWLYCVGSMGGDQCLCDRIDAKVLEMEEQIPTYFHERFHFQMNKQEQK